MSDPFTTAEQAIARFVEVSRQAHEEVVAAIDAIPDPDVALEQANDFFKEAEAIYTEATKLRTQTIGRIWEAKELSLTSLAGKLGGISRQRVGQIVTAYTRDKATGETEEEAPT